MARPQIEVDPALVEKLAATLCTMIEIGNIVGCSVDTLERRFADVIRRGRDNAKYSIRAKQFKLAVEKENCMMLIWLGKQTLGQREPIGINIEDIPDPEFFAEVERRANKLRKTEAA